MDNLYINISAGEFYENAPDALSIGDYRAIQTEFKSDKDFIAYYKQIGLYDAEYTYDLPILFVDENFYPLIMKSGNHQQGGVYIGEKAKRLLDELVQAQAKDVYGFLNLKQETVCDVPISSMLPMETLEYQSKALLEDGFMSGEFGELDFEDYIIFPLSVYENLPTQPSFIDSIAVSIEQNDDAPELARELLAYLRNGHTDENYSVMNYSTFAEEFLNRNVHVGELLNFLAAFILVVVVFGFIGLLIILLNQRNKEFAITLMCGAAPWQITLEMLIEIFLVVMTGVCIGNLISVLFLSMLGNETYHSQTLLLTLLGGIAVSGLVCLIPLNKMKHISPISILKNL